MLVEPTVARLLPPGRLAAPEGTHERPYSGLLNTAQRDAGISGPVLAELLLAITRHIGRGNATDLTAPSATRRDLMDELRLSAPTISKGLAVLERAGLTTEHGFRPSGGRPLGYLKLNNASMRIIGILVSDARPDTVTLQGAVTDLSGSRVEAPAVRTVQLPTKDAAAEREDALVRSLLDYATDIAAALDPQNVLLGVGIQIGGHVCDGILVTSPNLQLDDVPLVERLTAELDVPVFIENDITALTVRDHLYETSSLHAAGRRLDSYAVVSVLRAGIGAGLSLDGKVWRGSAGLASEPGHSPATGPAAAYVADTLCRCGSRGCMELVATPQGVLARLKKDKVKGRTIGEAAVNDPIRTEEALRDAGTALGNALLHLMLWVNPAEVRLNLPLELAPPGLEDVYVRAVKESSRDRAFSTARDTLLTPWIFENEWIEKRQAKAAAAIVLERVIAEISRDAAWRPDTR
jgi:predicted NBD/HSP70 family sugar kinase